MGSVIGFTQEEVSVPTENVHFSVSESATEPQYTPPNNYQSTTLTSELERDHVTIQRPQVSAQASNFPLAQDSPPPSVRADPHDSGWEIADRSGSIPHPSLSDTTLHPSAPTHTNVSSSQGDIVPPPPSTHSNSECEFVGSRQNIPVSNQAPLATTPQASQRTHKNMDPMQSVAGAAPVSQHKEPVTNVHCPPSGTSSSSSQRNPVAMDPVQSVTHRDQPLQSTEGYRHNSEEVHVGASRQHPQQALSAANVYPSTPTHRSMEPVQSVTHHDPLPSQCSSGQELVGTHKQTILNKQTHGHGLIQEGESDVGVFIGNGIHKGRGGYDDELDSPLHRQPPPNLMMQGGMPKSPPLPQGGSCDPHPFQQVQEGPHEPHPSQPLQGGPCEPHPSQPVQEGPREPRPSQPVQEGPREPRPSQLVQGGPREPHPSQPVQGGPHEPHPSQPVQGGHHEPHPSQPVQEGPREPHPSQPVQEGPHEPHPSQPVQEGSHEPHTSQPVQEGPHEPHPSQPVQEGPHEPHPSQPVQEGSHEPHTSQPVQEGPHEPHPSQPVQEGPHEPHPSQPVQGGPREPHTSQGGTREPHPSQPVHADPHNSGQEIVGRSGGQLDTPAQSPTNSTIPSFPCDVEIFAGGGNMSESTLGSYSLDQQPLGMSKPANHAVPSPEEANLAYPSLANSTPPSLRSVPEVVRVTKTKDDQTDEEEVCEKPPTLSMSEPSNVAGSSQHSQETPQGNPYPSLANSTLPSLRSVPEVDRVTKTKDDQTDEEEVREKPPTLSMSEPSNVAGSSQHSQETPQGNPYPSLANSTLPSLRSVPEVDRVTKTKDDQTDEEEVRETPPTLSMSEPSNVAGSSQHSQETPQGNPYPSLANSTLPSLRSVPEVDRVTKTKDDQTDEEEVREKPPTLSMSEPSNVAGSSQHSQETPQGNPYPSLANSTLPSLRSVPEVDRVTKTKDDQTDEEEVREKPPTLSMSKPSNVAGSSQHSQETPQGNPGK